MGRNRATIRHDALVAAVSVGYSTPDVLWIDKGNECAGQIHEFLDSGAIHSVFV